MKSLVRDVMLLGGAASAFLLLAVLAPVGAEVVATARATEVRPSADGQPAAEIRLAASHTNAPTERRVSTRATAADEAQVVASLDRDTAAVESRCDHVRRIGKFTVTRCD